MFTRNGYDGPAPKCYFTSSALPQFVNHDQLPNKKRPFSTVLGQTFSHALDIMLPTDSADKLQKALSDGKGTLQYMKVYMKPSDIIEGDFFNQYIKTGNILMLSEGRPGVDQIFSLSEGVVRLEVNKATFERMGLEGKAISSEGRKHVKARYAIEINLRLPSMVRGKKGFERIIWAFKNVLDRSVTWLFHDLEGPNDGSGPAAVYQPKVVTVEPEVEVLGGVKVPDFPDDLEQDCHDEATELLEWLTLAICGSPRVRHHDKIDPYLSRYTVPQRSDDAQMADDHVQDLETLRWRGAMPATFLSQMLLETSKAAGDGWLAFSAHAFDGKAYAFLQDKQHTMTWEYQD